jgi:hypothetical protein
MNIPFPIFSISWVDRFSNQVIASAGAVLLAIVAFCLLIVFVEESNETGLLSTPLKARRFYWLAMASTALAPLALVFGAYLMLPILIVLILWGLWSFFRSLYLKLPRLQKAVQFAFPKDDNASIQ